MISVIITAFREPNTIKKAVSSLAEQSNKDSEILVTAPDDETLNEAKKLKFSNLRFIKDSGKGKSAALNLAVSKAKGDILVLTDGDVFVGKDALKNLLFPFKDKKVGAVSGNPLSLSDQKRMYGFWAKVLTLTANKRRKHALKNNKRFFCSGYLFAIRKSIFPKLPEDLLSEDGFISHNVYEKGFRIDYAQNSLVYVKYPDNFIDWLKQKKRSAGGYNQLKKILGVEIRSLRKESLGFLDVMKQASSFRETFWLMNLFAARIYLWAAIYRDINMMKKNREELWERVESTK